jgi:hypothetical protein
MTELACDLVALSGLNGNREAVGVDGADMARVALELAGLSRARFEAEGKASPTDDLDGLFASTIAGEPAP